MPAWYTSARRLNPAARGGRLRDYFDRYDLDESGLIDSESELELLVTNVCFFVRREHKV